MTTPSTPPLTLTRIIKAPREQVFAAWTRPDMLTKWWGPGAVVCVEAHVDLRVGGTYRLANRFPDGKLIWITGTFNQVRAPEHLIYSWAIGDQEQPSLVEVNFSPHPEGTYLTLEHHQIADAATRDAHAIGWTGCLDKLLRMLSSRP